MASCGQKSLELFQRERGYRHKRHCSGRSHGLQGVGRRLHPSPSPSSPVLGLRPLSFHDTWGGPSWSHQGTDSPRRVRRAGLSQRQGSQQPLSSGGRPGLARRKLGRISRLGRPGAFGLNKHDLNHE